ncbi:MAG TPA: hypothetical protein VE981_08030 [Planctomycetota bacterium]|nr:hypothetical protein [Planctomycetota bacterium]
MTLAALAVLALLAQDPSSNGVAVERTVKRTTIDWLGRRDEVQRKERILIKGGNLAILDLTFGERLIIRSDLKKIYKADPLAREYAEFTFDEAAALRKTRLDEIRAAKARVPGTADEKELDDLLQGFDQFAAAPQVELKSDGLRREVIVNGDRIRISVDVNANLQAPGWMDALSAAGGFHPAVAEKLRSLGGLPSKGTIRYTLFMDRIVEQFEVTAAQAREIPDADFELPPGLVRTPLKGFEPPPARVLSRPPSVKQSFKEDDGDKPPPAPDKKDKP